MAISLFCWQQYGTLTNKNCYFEILSPFVVFAFVIHSSEFIAMCVCVRESVSVSVYLCVSLRHMFSHSHLHQTKFPFAYIHLYGVLSSVEFTDDRIKRLNFIYDIYKIVCRSINFDLLPPVYLLQNCERIAFVSKKI